MQPKSRKVRSRYVMASSLVTSALSLACVILTYLHDSDFLACILVSFSEVFSISLRIDGASIVYGSIVSVLWPLVTAYSLDYMSHEGHENRFFAFWLVAYGVVLGIAYSEDFLSLYFFYGTFNTGGSWTRAWRPETKRRCGWPLWRPSSASA